MGRTPSACASPKLTCSPPVRLHSGGSARKSRPGKDKDPDFQDHNCNSDDTLIRQDLGLSPESKILTERVQACPRDRVGEGGQRLFRKDYEDDRTGRLLLNSESDQATLQKDAWRTLPHQVTENIEGM